LKVPYIHALLTGITGALCISLYYNIEFLPNLALAQPTKDLFQGVIVNIVSSCLTFVAIYYFLLRFKAFDAAVESRQFGQIIQKVEELGPAIGKEINTRLDLDSNDLYKLCGLKDLEFDTRFQDFKVDRRPEGRNINAVSYLWADTYLGNEINAKIVRDQEGSPFLNVSFSSANGSLGCNITIRPQNERAKHREMEFRYLTFLAQASLDGNNLGEDTDRIGLAIRIINGKFQHWDYGSGPREYYQLAIATSDSRWTPISIDLNDSSSWHHFTSDGNQYVSEFDSEQPDFSVLSGLVIKLGKCGYLGEPAGPIRGSIRIKEIYFRTERLS